MMSKEREGERYRVTLEHVLGELFYIQLYLRYNGMLEAQKEILDSFNFFSLTAHAFFEDALTRLMRIFGIHSRGTANFWYLNNLRPTQVKHFLTGKGLELSDIDEFARKLTTFRDELHAHLDKSSIMVPHESWNKFSSVIDEFQIIVDVTTELLSELYVLEFDHHWALEDDNYTAKEIGMIFKACRESPDNREIFHPIRLAY